MSDQVEQRTAGEGPTFRGSRRAGSHRPPGRRTLRADAERNRRAILDAAGRAFAEHGMTVPLEQIAKAAGVGIGTVYRRFPSVDALVEELFQERLARWAGLVAELAELARTDPWEAFRRYVYGVAEAQGRDAAFAELLVEPIAGSQRFRDHHARAMRDAALLLHRARRAGAVRADLHECDLLNVHLALLGVVRGAAVLGGSAPPRFARLVLDACRGPAVTRESAEPLPEPPDQARSAVQRITAVNPVAGREQRRGDNDGE